ncbi:hypothetical protein [Thalassotalea ganghwensis]
MKHLSSAILLMLLSACARQVSITNANVGESLHTEIREDGSKIFEFSAFLLDAPKPIAGELSNKIQRVIASQRGRGSINRLDRQSRLTLQNTLSNYFEQRLAELSILELFCRDGYFVLEQFDTANEKRIKAECHDGASADDYQRFKSKS